MSISSIIIISIVVIALLFFKPFKRFSGHVNEALSDNYYYNGNKSTIQYSPMGNWFELGNAKMDADVASFEVLDSDYGKDKDKIFFKSIDVSSEVDYATFRAKERFAYDQDHVYVAYDHLPYGLREDISPTKTLMVIEGADPVSFENIDYDWNKDDKTYFYNYQAVQVDRASFEILNEAASKDKYTVYFHRKNDIVASSAIIDVASVEAINEHYIADKDLLYSYNYLAEDSEKAMTTFPVRDAETIMVLEHNYMLIDDGVYHDNKLMPMADRATFRIWKDTYYAADKNHAYYSEKPIEGADVETFHVFSYQAYTKDNNNVYFSGKKMEGVDLATFGPKEDESFFYKDKNHTYSDDEIVTD